MLFRTKQTKCVLAYAMLNIIPLYVFMFWGMLQSVPQMFLFDGANRNRGHFVSLSAYRGNKNMFFANRIRKLVFLR
jgi:hypothetical protein